MTTHTEHAVTESIRRHTGAVSLIVSGERPAPKAGAEILETARATEFYEDGHLTREYEGGSIEYVPTALTPNALSETLAQGRLLYRFTIYGTPPKQLGSLASGTYYTYVDFIEGPDFDEGRWIGRIVDEEGKVVGIVPGVEVKQVFSFHIHDQDREAHSRPEMHLHGLGVGDTEGRLWADTKLDFKPPTSTGSWQVTSGDWSPHGTGCMRTFYCTPLVAVAFR